MGHHTLGTWDARGLGGGRGLRTHPVGFVQANVVPGFD